MDAPSISASFLAALRAYDPALRVRWAVRSQCWVIERPMPPRHRQLLLERPRPYRRAKGLDRYDGWKEGYVDVLWVHRDLLDIRVFDTLAAHDLHRVGGIDRLNRALDELDAAEERAIDTETDTFCHQAGLEAADRMLWLDGHRVAMPGAAPPDQTFTVEVHDGFTVKVKKTLVGR